MISKNGKLVVAALAGMFALSAPLHAFAADDKGAEKKVACEGGNSCKGKGSCAGKDNSCAGKNACKGKGVAQMTEKECKDAGGKVAAPKEKK